MKKIPLGDGKYSLVDKEDFKKFSKFRWHIKKGRNKFYAQHCTRMGGAEYNVKLHRAILDLNYGDNKMVDHINGNGLDNRKINLRICGYPQNASNSRRYSNNSSGYKGVHWHKLKEKWQATIRYFGNKIHVGYFSTALKAKRAYNKKSKELFGEFHRSR